jgi:hypothetical protein
MIKLDTHGYEVPFLCGATETLRNTNLLVNETYNFRVIESSLLFHEIIALYARMRIWRYRHVRAALARSRFRILAH